MRATETEGVGSKAGTSTAQPERTALDQWMERATAMLDARPATTLAIAVGTGVVLGATALTRVGRLLFIAAIGIGTEVLLRKNRASSVEDGPSE